MTRCVHTNVLRERVSHGATLALVVSLAASAGAFAQDEAPAAPGASHEGEAGGTKRAKEAPPPSWHRDRFSLTKGKTRLELTGYAQEDFRRYNWDVQGDPAGQKRARERELRRVRIGARARIGKLQLETTVEPRKLPTGSRLQALNASYAFAKAFTLRAGFFKLPGSKEFNALTQNTDFVDRSMIASRLVAARDWGVTGAGTRGRLEYLVGVFKGDGASSPRRTGTAGAGRISVEIAKGLQLSGSILEGQVNAAPLEGAQPSAKGASGVTATGFSFWSRPYVNGSRRRMSNSLSYSHGSFRFLGEYLEEREQRKGQGAAGQDLPDSLGRGFSAQAAWLITGKRRGVLVEPERSVFHGGPGAVELVARAETLRFDDTSNSSLPPSLSSRAVNIAPTGVSAIEGGVNYWPSNFMRFQATAIWEKYNDPLIAPVPGHGGRYFSLLARVQFMIP
jgi:phosphate-selective porin